MKKLLLTNFIAILYFSALAQNPAMDICPIPISSNVPSSQVYSTEGETLQLDSIVNSKPTILIFYRGGWCPYCKRQLSTLQEVKKEINELGYQIIALSADHYSNSQKIAENKKLTFQVYSDFKQNSAKKYGISFVLDQKTYKKYKNVLQFDIEKWGGNDRHELPVPSVFIIKEKRILYSYVNPEYKTRLAPEVLLAVLQDLENKNLATYRAIKKLEPGDVESPEALVTAVLSTISANKDETADWKRFETLFLPKAQISVLQHKNDTSTLLNFTLKSFIENSIENSTENGFREYSTGNTIEEYNGLATVFQSYVALQGETQVKGVNTYQLVYQDKRWWIASLIWTSNKNGIEVPEQYIQKSK